MEGRSPATHTSGMSEPANLWLRLLPNLPTKGSRAQFSESLERQAGRSVNGEFNIRIGIPAPVLKRGVRTRQLRNPDLIAVVGEFHGPNGSRMAPHLNENGIEPALGLRVPEVMVSDPEHQSLPFLCSSVGLLRWRFEPGVQVPRATTFQLIYNLCVEVLIPAPAPVVPSTQEPHNPCNE